MDHQEMTDAGFAVFLYGSAARGDNDSSSDVDVFAVGEVPKSALSAAVKQFDGPVSLSSYSWKEFDAMREYGSLFLHHLRVDGRSLISTGDRGRRVAAEYLESLPPYRHVMRDVSAFRSALDDIGQSLSEDGAVWFEMSVLASTIRHAAILACYVMGELGFGRSAPVANVVRQWNLGPDCNRHFDRLYEYRLFEEGRAPQPQPPTRSEVLEWLHFGQTVVDKLEVIAHAFSARMSPAA
jgi:predicted nucleotidyltransferase